ncbi:unnamed protein product [Coccothraustes coccothraustes]
MPRTGPSRTGLDWTGPNRLGANRIGPNRIGPHRTELVSGGTTAENVTPQLAGGFVARVPDSMWFVKLNPPMSLHKDSSLPYTQGLPMTEAALLPTYSSMPCCPWHQVPSRSSAPAFGSRVNAVNADTENFNSLNILDVACFKKGFDIRS